jgi:hypothetical protein
MRHHYPSHASTVRSRPAQRTPHSRCGWRAVSVPPGAPGAPTPSKVLLGPMSQLAKYRPVAPGISFFPTAPVA